MTSEAQLRQLLTIGLGRRYTLRVRAERGEFIIEDIEEAGRLPNCQHGVRHPGFVASAPEPGAAMDAARCVIDRMQIELKAIEQAGLAAYFLLVADVVRYGRSIGAISVNRSASASSLVAYLLEISAMDPMRHGLLFERFWHPQRTRLPAIWLDFADDRRDAVLKYARKQCDRRPGAQLVTDLKSDYGDDLPTLGLLGQKALTILRRTCERVKQAKGVGAPIEHLALDDTKIYDLLKSGDTGGIFGLEADEIRDLCRKFQPTSIAHIAALMTAHSVAPYSPDPASFVSDFIARRHGQVGTKHLHQTLEPILRETFGVLLYEEQLMQVAQAVAGFTLGRADLMRRAIAICKAEEVAQHRQLFVSGARERHGISESKANQIFRWLEKCARYSYCKSNSTAGAMLAYQTAYLKANYLVEFLSAGEAI